MAQKLTNITLPLNDAKVTLSPAAVRNTVGGAGRGGSLRINCAIQPSSTGWALAGPGALEARLAAYQARREGRVRKVVDAASSNAWKYHLSFPPLRWAAHAALRVGGTVAPGKMLHQFDWIYEHDVVGGG